MFEVLSAIVLGIIEGLTEFIPVSSTGHLILADTVLGFSGPPGKVFDVVIQVGAILAVCWVYRVRLWNIVTGLRHDPEARRLAVNVLLAFLPAAGVGALAHGFIKSVLFSPMVVAVSLIVGGFAILFIERVLLRASNRVEDKISYGVAFGIGLCQLLSMIPGVSRSGATIMGALVLGIERKTATEFSFFLAIPTMLGAAGYDLYKSGDAISMHDAIIIGVGLVSSFIVAVLIVRWLVRFVSRHDFVPFAWYRIGLGLVALVLLMQGR